MPITSGSFTPNPNDTPDGYIGTFTVTSNTPGCPAKTFQVAINVATGACSMQVTPPPGGTTTTTGSSTSSNQQTTTPTGGPPPSYKSPSQNQGGSGQPSTGISHKGGGQSGGTSTAVQNANQQAGQTTDANGNPNGKSSTTWTLSMTVCFPGDPECCYTINISGSNNGSGGNAAPTAS